MGDIDMETAGLQRSGKPVEITIGNDGLLGRVVRAHKEQARAKDRDDLEKRLAEVSLHARNMATELTLAQIRNKALEERLKEASVAIKSLRDEVDSLRQKLGKVRAAVGE
jgi:chromosome segregation ATPase